MHQYVSERCPQAWFHTSPTGLCCRTVGMSIFLVRARSLIHGECCERVVHFLPWREVYHSPCEGEVQAILFQLLLLIVLPAGAYDALN